MLSVALFLGLKDLVLANLVLLMQIDNQLVLTFDDGCVFFDHLVCVYNPLFALFSQVRLEVL